MKFPVPDSAKLDKDKTRMNLFRAEIKYLAAHDWIMYVPGLYDPVTEEWKTWADRSTPENIIAHDEAVAIQKLRDIKEIKDREKDKENADTR